MSSRFISFYEPSAHVLGNEARSATPTSSFGSIYPAYLDQPSIACRRTAEAQHLLPAR